MKRARVTYPAVDVREFGHDGLCVRGYSSLERILEGRYHGDTIKGHAIVEDDSGYVHVVSHQIMEILNV